MLLSEGRQKCTIREAERMIQRMSQGKEKKTFGLNEKRERKKINPSAFEVLRLILKLNLYHL